MDSGVRCRDSEGGSDRPDYPVYFIIPAEEGVIDPEIPEWVEKVTLTAEG